MVVSLKDEMENQDEIRKSRDYNWMEDDESSVCVKCEATFTFALRRHHDSPYIQEEDEDDDHSGCRGCLIWMASGVACVQCRRCGVLICWYCMDISPHTGERVCRDCMAFLECRLLESTTRSLSREEGSTTSMDESHKVWGDCVKNACQACTYLARGTGQTLEGEFEDSDSSIAEGRSVMDEDEDVEEMMYDADLKHHDDDDDEEEEEREMAAGEPAAEDETGATVAEAAAPGSAAGSGDDAASELTATNVESLSSGLKVKDRKPSVKFNEEVVVVHPFLPPPFMEIAAAAVTVDHGRVEKPVAPVVIKEKKEAVVEEVLVQKKKEEKPAPVVVEKEVKASQQPPTQKPVEKEQPPPKVEKEIKAAPEQPKEKTEQKPKPAPMVVEEEQAPQKTAAATKVETAPEKPKEEKVEKAAVVVEKEPVASKPAEKPGPVVVGKVKAAVAEIEKKPTVVPQQKSFVGVKNDVIVEDVVDGEDDDAEYEYEDVEVVKAPKPEVKAPEPVAKAPEPVAKVAEPAAKAPVPVVKVPEPAGQVPEPAAKVAEPAVTSQKPVVKVAQPVVTSPKPVVKVAEPVVTAPKPVVKVAEPVVTSPKPVVKVAQPVVTSPKPVVKVAEPVVTSPKPVVKVAEPVVTSPKPVVKVAEPLADVPPLEPFEEVMADARAELDSEEEDEQKHTAAPPAKKPQEPEPKSVREVVALPPLVEPKESQAPSETHPESKGAAEKAKPKVTIMAVKAPAVKKEEEVPCKTPRAPVLLDDFAGEISERFGRVNDFCAMVLCFFATILLLFIARGVHVHGGLSVTPFGGLPAGGYGVPPVLPPVHLPRAPLMGTPTKPRRVRGGRGHVGSHKTPKAMVTPTSTAVVPAGSAHGRAAATAVAAATKVMTVVNSRAGGIMKNAVKELKNDPLGRLSSKLHKMAMQFVEEGLSS